MDTSEHIKILNCFGSNKSQNKCWKVLQKTGVKESKWLEHSLLCLLLNLSPTGFQTGEWSPLVAPGLIYIRHNIMDIQYSTRDSGPHIIHSFSTSPSCCSRLPKEASQSPPSGLMHRDCVARSLDVYLKRSNHTNSHHKSLRSTALFSRVKYRHKKKAVESEEAVHTISPEKVDQDMVIEVKSLL